MVNNVVTKEVTKVILTDIKMVTKVTTVTNQGLVIPKELITKSLIKKIKAELIVSPISTYDTGSGPFDNKILKIYKILKDNSIVVPLNVSETLSIDINKAILDYTDYSVKKETLSDTIMLREGDQQNCFNVCSNEFTKEFGGGIINLTTASGKTILAMKLSQEHRKISKKSGSTLIVVNKREHIHQWKAEILKFIPDARIGIIQGTVFDTENKDFVLGMLHTISMKENIQCSSFNEISCCFIDEVHNISSEIFSKIIFKVRPRYLFGLTGTLERKDGLHKIIEWYIGPILYSNISSAKKQETEIHIYKYKGESSKEETMRNGKLSISTMTTNIANDVTRNDMIIKILRELAIDSNRNVLLLSDRISQLKYINSKLDNSALYIGKMKTDELKESKNKQILLATYKLAGEGFSLEKLNCLVFGTSRSSINQAIGRIYRKQHTELLPVIVDIYDDFSVFKPQYYKRRKVYKELISDIKFKNCN